VQATYGREQVGPERDVRAPAAQEDVEHLHERLADQVVGVRSVDQQAGEAGRGVDVPGEEQAVGSDVAVADPRDEFGVRQLGSVHVRGAHGIETAFCRW
jgi:hypothetical protein